MKLLDLLGAWRWLLAGAVVAALAWAHHADKAQAVKAARDDVMGQWARAELRRSEVALRAEQHERAEEQRRAAAQKEILDAYEEQLAQARADRDSADAAAGRLQQRVAALISASRGPRYDPTAAEAGPAASDPAGMLADVLSRCVARVQLLADLADQRSAAGTACERAYESLTDTTSEVLQ